MKMGRGQGGRQAVVRQAGRQEVDIQASSQTDMCIDGRRAREVLGRCWRCALRWVESEEGRKERERVCSGAEWQRH